MRCRFKLGFAGAVAMAALSFGTAGPAWADPITSLFNTGVDSSGIPLATGTTPDPHYALVSAPVGAVTTLQALTSGVNDTPPQYLGTDSASSWIGPNVGAPNTAYGPAGDYKYQTSFTLATNDINGVVIAGQWAMDNTGVDILVNGISTGQTVADSPHNSPFEDWHSFTIPAADLVQGLNTLDFIVYNGPFPGNQPSPTAVRVEFTTADQPANPIPEPVSLGLFGAALVSLGLLRRRA